MDPDENFETSVGTSGSTECPVIDVDTVERCDSTSMPENSNPEAAECSDNSQIETIEVTETETLSAVEVKEEEAPVPLPDLPAVEEVTSANLETETLITTEPAPCKRSRKKNWKYLEETRHMLRPRKSDVDGKSDSPAAKKLKKVETMLPPELPVASQVVGEVAEMPQLHSENSSSAGSESRSDLPTSTFRRRKHKRLTMKKKKRHHSIPRSDSSKERTVPSPSVAECNVDPACPESSVTANEAAHSPLCLCGKKPQVFVSSINNPGDLTCQAIDSLDGRVIGCCNPLPLTTVGLHRPSTRTPYIMLCAVHLQRLTRHNCCPGCGFFCLQGTFLACSGRHQYHSSCARQEGCLHCGDTSPPKTVILSMKSRRGPTGSAFLPKSKPFKGTKPAKISPPSEQTCSMVEEPLPVTITPEVAAWRPSGDPQDPDKLANLLGVACRGLVAPIRRSPITAIPRYTAKQLLTAVKIGDGVKLLKIISTGLNPRCTFPELKDQTCLHVAASLGHTMIVHLLLQAGLAIDLLDADLNSPLSISVLSRCNEVTKYLVKAGASIITRDAEGMTPLHVAAKIGNKEACTLLLKAPNPPRRFIDILDDGGWTPLVWAAEYNQLEVVRLLLSEGGDTQIRDPEQNIALHWATYGGCVEIVELLLANGSDASAVNVNGDTPLHLASRRDKYDCVLLLLARGAATDVKNNAGQTAREAALPGSPIAQSIALNEQLNALISRYRDPGPRILCSDISRGRERNPIQCINSVDDAPLPNDYIYVAENVFTSNISVNRTVTAMMPCTCQDKCTGEGCTCTSISLKAWYDSDGRLIPEFNYTNSPIIFECNPMCGCNQILCQNRVVQNGLTCRLQLFRTKTCGWGLKTLKEIPRGTFVCEYLGEIISDSEAEQRQDDSYLFDLDSRDEDTFCIDARKYGNMARFINHMCEYNLIPVHVYVEHQDMRFPRIAFFANRDIPAGTELGYDYGGKFWAIKWKTFTCTCGSANCMYTTSTIHSTLERHMKKLRDLERNMPVLKRGKMV